MNYIDIESTLGDTVKVIDNGFPLYIAKGERLERSIKVFEDEGYEITGLDNNIEGTINQRLYHTIDTEIIRMLFNIQSININTNEELDKIIMKARMLGAKVEDNEIDNIRYMIVDKSVWVQNKDNRNNLMSDKFKNIRYPKAEVVLRQIKFPVNSEMYFWNLNISSLTISGDTTETKSLKRSFQKSIVKGEVRIEDVDLSNVIDISGMFVGANIGSVVFKDKTLSKVKTLEDMIACADIENIDMSNLTIGSSLEENTTKAILFIRHSLIRETINLSNLTIKSRLEVSNGLIYQTDIQGSLIMNNFRGVEDMLGAHVIFSTTVGKNLELKNTSLKQFGNIGILLRKVKVLGKLDMSNFEYDGDRERVIMAGVRAKEMDLRGFKVAGKFSSRCLVDIEVDTLTIDKSLSIDIKEQLIKSIKYKELEEK